MQTIDQKQSKETDSGEIVGVFHRWKWMAKGDGSRFCLGVLEDKTVIKGDCLPSDLLPGISYKFAGKWTTHKEHGRSFQFRAYQQQAPHSRTAVIQYLTKYAEGLGPVWASRLYDAFGTDAVRTLRENPKLVNLKIPTIPLSKAEQASIGLCAYKKQEDTRIELNSLFDGRGFPKKMIDECLKIWSISAYRVISHDPFALMVRRLPGAGFARCDRLYRDLGLPLDRLKRQLFCLLSGLREHGNGNTWYKLRIAEQIIREKIDGLTEVNWKRAIKLGMRAGWLAVRQDDQREYWFTTKKQANDEATITEAVAKLCHPPKVDGIEFPQWPSADQIEGLTDHQREVCRKVLQGSFSILAGTPGTGKTTAAAKIVKACLKTIHDFQIAVCAPTGKAAIRIEQSMHNCGLESIQCSTIHRLLGVNRNGHDGNGWGFLYNENNKLPYKLILIEESSMIDAGLFAQIVKAIQPGCLVLMIGDPYQLPPVEHGAPLRDLLAAGVASGELTEVMRNGGRIVEQCKNIREGRRAVPSAQVALPFENWLHLESKTPPIIAAKLRQVGKSVGGREFNGKPIDPVWDCQILCGLNDKGELSRDKLNPILQAILNPNGKEIEHTKFRVGDKVICNSNCEIIECDQLGRPVNGTDETDDKEASDESAITCFVANGDIGRCETETKNGYVVFIQSCGKRVLVKKFAGKDESEQKANFELAYAITFHKSQGSQWPIVITVIDQAAQRLASRELWYTANSRPESLLVTIGQRGVLNKQCLRVALNERKTFLAEDVKRAAWVAACDLVPF